MDGFIRGVALLSRACGFVAAMLILVSVVVVTHMVVQRYFFGQPTIWQTEFVIYALIASTLLGSSYVLLHRGHVNMDIVPIYAGPRLRFWLAMVASVGALGFCLLLFWYGTHYWYEAWSKNWHSDTLWRVPLWKPYLALPVGLGALSLQYVADILSLATGRTLPFGLPPKTGTEALVESFPAHADTLT